MWRVSVGLLAVLMLATGMAAEYVGRQACAGCHEKEHRLWQGSPHDLAMQEATEETVLGDFRQAVFSQQGRSARFFRRDGHFMVNTEGADGKRHDFRIAYTFGAYPLQQYLIPMSDGRLQVLDIAWDSRPGKKGGQRWFALHPDEEIRPGDVLHWTGPNLNWNYMCADCHSTRLKKGWDDRTGVYHTTWSEIDVSCEACHGPGSSHLAWAKARAEGESTGVSGKGLTVQLNERKGIRWLVDGKTGKPRRSARNGHRAEIDVCAPCHSRRSQLTDNWHPGMPFLDGYLPSLLEEQLYYPDGQMRDEVFVWGSFLQSRMYQAGVTCSDCHDPHGADLRLPGEQVCYQCHQKQRYATRKHHFHDEAGAGASCVECHMPATTFMQVDERHDHGFRIPRPDLSASLDVPNACNRCHDDRTADWALARLRDWYGHVPKGQQQFARALQAGRTGDKGSLPVLLDLLQNSGQAAIVRGTVLALLPDMDSQVALIQARQMISGDDPLLRLAALQALESAPQSYRAPAFSLVQDEYKAVRIEAARLLAGHSRAQLGPGQAEMLDKAIKEYIQTQQFNGERPEAQVNLGNLYMDLKELSRAETAYRKAIALQPRFVPAHVNLAQLLAGEGREKEAAAVLQSALTRVPGSADLHHALGLSLVRQESVDQALPMLARAVALEPDNPRYPYVYAVALQSVGLVEKAIGILQEAHRKHPENIEILYVLAMYSKEAGRMDDARRYLHKLDILVPGNRQIRALLQEME